MKHLLLYSMLLFFVASMSAVAPVPVGTGGGGRTIYPAYNPHDDKNVFVGCDMGSSYSSRDGGKTWIGYDFSTYAKFAFHPTDANIVYAYSRYIYKSTDRGASWNLLYPQPSNINYSVHSDGKFSSSNGWFYDLKDKSQCFAPAAGGATFTQRIIALESDPAKPSNLYALLAGTSNISPRIYKSTDGGETFDEWAVLQNSPGIASEYHSFGSIVVRADGSVYVFTNTGLGVVKKNGAVQVWKTKASYMGDIIVTASDTTFFSLEHGTNPSANFTDQIVKSTDFGVTWTSVTASCTFMMNADTKRSFPVFAAANKDVIYATYSGANSGEWMGICKTENGGLTWQRVMWANEYGDYASLRLRNWGTQDQFLGMLNWSGVGQGMTASKTNPNICMGTSTYGGYQTVNGGLTWEEVASTMNRDNDNTWDNTWSAYGLENAGTHGVFIDPFDHNHFFLPYTDTGLFMTTDNGKSFSMAERPDGGDGTVGLPKTWGNAFNMAIDTEIEGFVIGTFCRAQTLNDNGIYDALGPFHTNCTSYHGGIAISTNGGVSWKASGILSSNRAESYTDSDPLNSGLPMHCLPSGVAIDPASGDHESWRKRTVYVSCYGYGIYKSTDGGQHFSPFNTGINESQKSIEDLVWSKDYSRLYAKFRQQTTGAKKGGLYVLDVKNGATSWTEITGFPAELEQNHVFFGFDVGVDGTMYMTGSVVADGIGLKNGGAFLSTDGGATWRNIFPTNVKVSYIAAGKLKPNNIYITTYKGTVYMSTKGKNTQASDWQLMEDFTYHPDPCKVTEDLDQGDFIYVGTICGGVYKLDVNNVANGIKQVTTGKKLSIYPTVTSDNFKLYDVEGNSVAVYNMQGLKVYGENKLSKDATVFVSGWTNGLYIVKVSDANGKTVGVAKVVKK